MSLYIRALPITYLHFYHQFDQILTYHGTTWFRQAVIKENNVKITVQNRFWKTCTDKKKEKEKSPATSPRLWFLGGVSDPLPAVPRLGFDGNVATGYGRQGIDQLIGQKCSSLFCVPKVRTKRKTHMSTMHMLREVKHALKTSTWGENTAANIRLQQFINCKQLISNSNCSYYH